MMTGKTEASADSALRKGSTRSAKVRGKSRNRPGIGKGMGYQGTRRNMKRS